MKSSGESEETNELLSLLAEKADASAGLSGQQSLRLQMLVRSAKVSLEVARIKKRWQNPPHDDDGKKHLSDSTKEVVEACQHEQQWLEDLPEDASLDAGARTLSLTVVLNALGQAHYWLNHRKDARAALIRAMALSPNFIEPYITMAQILLNGKLQADADWPAAAERMLKEALRIDPASRQGLRLLAQLYGNPVFGKEPDAIGILEKLDPDAESAFLLATLYDRVGRTKDAIRRMHVAIALGRNPDECYRLFALYSVKLPDNDPDRINLLGEAALLLEKLDPDAQSAFLLATLYDRLGRTKDAILRMQKAISLGRSPEAYRLLALYCLKLPDSDPDKIKLLAESTQSLAATFNAADAEKSDYPDLITRLTEEWERLTQSKKREKKAGTTAPDPSVSKPT